MTAIENTRGDNAVSLLAAGILAAFGAAFLAGRVAGRASNGERRFRVAEPAVPPATIRIPSQVVSIVGYPVAYLPIAWLIASALRRRGVDDSNTIVRSALAGWAVYRIAKPFV